MTMSASLPTSSEPTRLSIRSCFAGLIVTRESAWSSVSPPHLIDLAASVFRCRASSVGRDLLRHLVAFEDVLEGGDLEAELLGDTHQHQDLVGAVGVAVDEA